jgi:hypothetical protein
MLPGDLDTGASKRPFSQRVRCALVQRLSPEARLLVVVNAPPMARAYAIVKGGLEERGRIVFWRAVSDDRALGEAPVSLLSVTEPARQQD